MYTLLHGAKKNVGDFLIYSQAKRLIQTHTGEQEFLELPRWNTLDDHLKAINATRAIVLCGGPGYFDAFYPRIFPLVSRLEDIHVPIIPFGLGWSGQPMHHPERFEFTPQSMTALRYIHDRCEASSCRDVVTQSILNRHSFDNVVMSGCPVWYHLPSIGKPFVPPAKIRRVVVTTPQRVNLLTALRKWLRRNFGFAYPLWKNLKRLPGHVRPFDWSTDRSQRLSLNGQCRQLLTAVRRLFPDAECYSVFHRGFAADDHTSKSETQSLTMLRRHAKGLGYRIVNAAYDVKSIAFYNDCDLHVGYRVHAHIRFLSLRKPSVLLQEDGRGVGLSTTLMLPDVSAHSDQPVTRVRAQIEADLAANFERFQETCHRIDENYQTAVKFLKTFP